MRIVKETVLTLFVLFAAVSLPASEPCYKAEVTAVIDGDTLDIRFTGICPPGCGKKERVRIIGADAPEIGRNGKKSEPYAETARMFTDMLWKKKVNIQPDPAAGLRDQYKRLLAYIYYNPSYAGQRKVSGDLSEDLIRAGYAKTMNFRISPEKAEILKNAEKKAKDEKTGIWK